MQTTKFDAFKNLFRAGGFFNPNHRGKLVGFFFWWSFISYIFLLMISGYILVEEITYGYINKNETTILIAIGIGATISGILLILAWRNLRILIPIYFGFSVLVVIMKLLAGANLFKLEELILAMIPFTIALLLYWKRNTMVPLKRGCPICNFITKKCKK